MFSLKITVVAIYSFMETKKAFNFYKTYKIYYTHIQTHILLHMFLYIVHDT